MLIDLEPIMERAFAKAFHRLVQSKVEGILARAFGDGSAIGKRLEEKIEQAVQRFMVGGIQQEKTKPVPTSIAGGDKIEIIRIAPYEYRVRPAK